MANYVASLIKFCAFATAHVAARRAHSSYRLLCGPARAAGDLIPSTHTSERGGLAGRESDSSYTHFWAGRMAGRRFDSFYTHPSGLPLVVAAAAAEMERTISAQMGKSLVHVSNVARSAAG